MVIATETLNKFPWVARLILFVTGALAPLIFAPFHLWPLAFLLPGVFWWLTAAVPGKEAFWRGWWFGLGLFGAGISWVYFSMRTVDTPVWISLFLTTAFCIGMAFLFALQAWLPALLRRWTGRPPWVLFPLLWLGFEGIRSTLFTGMPWLLWGTLATDTWLRGWLPIGGVFLTSFWVLLGAGALWQLASEWMTQRRAWLPATALALGILLFTWGAGFALLDREYTQPSQDTPIEVAAMQGNVEQSRKWLRSERGPTLNLYENLNARHPGAALLVWPETAITAFPDELPNYLASLDRVLASRSQTLVSGLPLRGEGLRYYNGMGAWGNGAGEYRKQRLVPFGEYLPLQGLLQGLIAFFDLPMSGFSQGGDGQPPMTMTHNGETLRLAPLICYEAAYPGLSRQQAMGSDLLVVISNDAWFGRSLAPRQHLQITRARAIENQRDMVRSTQNGISALIDAHGRILERSDQFVVATVGGELTPRQGTTPYQRWGEWLVVMLSALVLAAGCWVSRRTN